MVKKILVSSLITSSILLGGTLSELPLKKDFISTDNGGNISAVDAYQDGVGIFIAEKNIDNSSMNKMVFKYGEEAKESGETLGEFVSDNGTTKEKAIAPEIRLTALSAELYEVGASCDDGDATTENDVYLDIEGTCQGNEIVVPDTITCNGETIGTEINIAGTNYLVVDNDSIRNNLDRAETLCTSNVTGMYNMFKSNSSFNQDISKWDVSNVQYMSSMFRGATSFNQDISKWDVSNVTDMSYMFDNAKIFNKPLNNWNTSNVRKMSYMFRDTNLFNQPLNNWNTSLVVQIQYMFDSAQQFNQDISNWDLSSVTHMSGMFNFASSMTESYKPTK